MSALRGGLSARVRYLAAVLLLGSVAVLLAMPTSVAASPQVPELPPLPSPSVPLPSVPPLPPLPPLPSPPSMPSPTPPSLVTPPLPTPPVLGTPLPTPSLPVSLGPSPSPTAGATPTPGTVPGGPGAGGGQPGSGAGGGNPPGGGSPPQGIQIPILGFTLTSPTDVALLAAVAVLPLLFGIWVLVFGRAWNEARRSRQAQVRLAIANELGIRPRELISLETEALFKLRERAAFDELTGTLRRAAGMAALEREIARARRVKAPLTVAFVDLDGLKQANDKRGHKAGDEMLRGLASILTSGLRGQDLVTRYGGDEFVCVLPDTPADAARAKLSSIQAEADKAGIRFSTGAAQLERSDDVVSLLARADREMYEAKAHRGEIRQLRPEPVTRRDLLSQPETGA